MKLINDFISYFHVKKKDDCIHKSDKLSKLFLEECAFRKDSLRTVERSALETHFFDENMLQSSDSSYHSYQGDFKYDMMNNVCVCMVDIVGFSSWCSNHLPNIIARAMIEYNDWIVNLIHKYPGIKKIELVGDCCMIISGIGSEEDESLKNSYIDIVCLAIDMLENINSLKCVFQSQNIGIRIGIHVSDLIGTYLNNPCKYQLFGNDINICSRLESSAIPNTIHISEKTMMCIENLFINIRCRCITGNAIHQSYKGVGFKTSYQLFLKKNEFFLINCNYHFCKRIQDACSQYEFVTDTYENIISNIKSFKYCAIIINISKSRALHDFNVSKVMETLKTNTLFLKQKCILLIDSLHHQQAINDYEYEHDDILNFDTNDFYNVLRSLILSFVHPNPNKFSLDVSLEKYDKCLKSYP